MKTYRLIIFIVAFCSLNIALSKAQTTGYIIKPGNDTVRCELKVDLWFGKVKWKTETESKWHKVTTDSVKEFYLDDKHTAVRAVLLPKSRQPQFVPLIERGKISVYQKVVECRYYTTVYWYASKGAQDTLLEIKNNDFLGSNSRKERKATVESLIADNPKVYASYKAADDFSFRQILSTIHYYNTGQPLIWKAAKRDENIIPKDDVY